MITLVPGPSQLSPETKEDLRHALVDGVAELSHRSKKFTEISAQCIQGLRSYLNIPDDYRVFYLDSASAAWHSLAANLVEKRSFHFINGSFSAKAKEASALLWKEALSDEVTWGEQNRFKTEDIPEDTELITACFNETSTGVKMLQEEVLALKEQCPFAMLAIDITSCAGGVPITFRDADAWYFSVQKCFGLPAGLGILVISPRAYERSLLLKSRRINCAGIWAWDMLETTMKNDAYQTPHTPNVMNIYLLGEQCARWNKDGGLNNRHASILTKKKRFEEWIEGQTAFAPFVKDKPHRSDTVLVVEAIPETITKARAYCKENGIELGAGYGQIKSRTFRIANFPAISVDIMRKTLTLLGHVAANPR